MRSTTIARRVRLAAVVTVCVLGFTGVGAVVGASPAQAASSTHSICVVTDVFDGCKGRIYYDTRTLTSTDGKKIVTYIKFRNNTSKTLTGVGLRVTGMNCAGDFTLRPWASREITKWCYTPKGGGTATARVWSVWRTKTTSWPLV